MAKTRLQVKAIPGPAKPSKSSWKWTVVEEHKDPYGATCKVCHSTAKEGDVVVSQVIGEPRNPTKTMTVEQKIRALGMTPSLKQVLVIHKSCLRLLLEIAPEGDTITDAWESIRSTLIENGGI